MTVAQPTPKELDRLIVFHAKTIHDAIEYPTLPHHSMTQDEMEIAVDRLRDLIHARRNLGGKP